MGAFMHMILFTTFKKFVTWVEHILLSSVQMKKEAFMDEEMKSCIQTQM